MANARDLVDIALDASREIPDERIPLLLAELAAMAEPKIVEGQGTARIISPGGRVTIEFYRSFLEKHIETPEDLLFVLLHEIGHKVRGDLHRKGGPSDVKPIARLAWNVAADILVNSWLLRHCFPGGSTLLERFYRRLEFPSALLMPPKAMARTYGPRYGFETLPRSMRRRRAPHGVSAPNFKALAARVFEAALEGNPSAPKGKGRAAQLANAYVRGWGENVSLTRLYSLIRPFFGSESRVPLLGDHKGSHEVSASLRKLLNRFPGIGVSVDCDELRVEADRDAKVPVNLIRKIARTLESDPCHAVRRPVNLAERTPVPCADRRAMLWLEKGLWPFFFERRQPAVDRDPHRVHLYLDVSGSVHSLIPLLYGLALRLEGWVGETVYLFSNRVVEATLEDVRQGRVQTTGGTDIDCVVAHASKNRFRRLLLVTDGYVHAERATLATLERERIEPYVLLTERRRPHHDLDWAKEVWELEG